MTRIFTIAICLLLSCVAQAQYASSATMQDRVVLRLLQGPVPQTMKAAETLVQSKLCFVTERLPQEGDTEEENRRYSGRKYYVRSDGNDVADGLTPATAWKSLEKVNNAVLGFGDTVLFRRGDVFRGHLEPKSGSDDAPMFYGAYGSGEKPVIEPSYDASSPHLWQETSPGIWRCIQPSNNEIGNIIFNHGSAGCGWKVDRRSQIMRDLQFCWVMEEDAVYLKSKENPGIRFSSIELAEKQHVISEAHCHDIVYDGLWLRYGAAHGIGGSNVARISIKNCDISWIGGSTLYFDNEGRGVRYGNGIEFWSGASDILVEGCRIWECWDAGLTNQSNVDGVRQRNITYRGNEIWNCEYSYEYWQQGDSARTENILFENNICRDAGSGWGHLQRWNPNAAHLMFYDTTASTDGFTIRGNTFSRTENFGIRLFGAWYPFISMTGNVWDIPERILCLYHGRPTSNLIYKYPDHLDQIHKDSHKEIQSEAIERPLVLKGKKAYSKMKAIFNFD